MSNITHLKTHTDINEVLKRRHNDVFSILYVSPWCKWSGKMEKLAEQWATNHPEVPMYKIDSWNTPEAFGTFNITSAPALLTTEGKGLRVVVEYPSLYNYFTK